MATSVKENLALTDLPLVPSEASAQAVCSKTYLPPSATELLEVFEVLEVVSIASVGGVGCSVTGVFLSQMDWWCPLFITIFAFLGRFTLLCIILWLQTIKTSS